MAGLFDFIKGNTLTFIDKKLEFGDIWTFTFKPNRKVDWKAGQHILLTVPQSNPDRKGTKRMFSVSTAPYESIIQITTHVGIEKQSTFKQALLNLKSGDEISGRGPVGPMTITDETKNYVFVTGGIGITPFRSILKQLNYENKRLHVRLLYGNRDTNILFKDELEAIASNNKNLHLKYIISPERINAPILRDSTTNIAETIFFISGPKPMVAEMKNLLKELGAKNIKSDPFYGYA